MACPGRRQRRTAIAARRNARTDIKPEWTGKDVTVMPYLRKPNEEVSVKTTVKDTMHYVVIPQKGSIEKDFSKTPQMNQYRINNRSASELTIQRLKREISFDSSAVREAIRKITDDYKQSIQMDFQMTIMSLLESYYS